MSVQHSALGSGLAMQPMENKEDFYLDDGHLD
jgi:hypothetical protein